MEAIAVIRTEETYIPTFTGLKFWPLAPITADICIEDIAHALAYECRFNGHTKQFYSVADHSIRVSRHVEQMAMQCTWRTYESLEQIAAIALWGLLHDASEAYLKDLPAPIKHAPGIGIIYRQYERNLMDAIALRFGLMPHEPAIVKDADNILLATEARDLITADEEMRRHGRWSVATPLKETIIPLTAFDAEREFLRRFETLTIRRDVSKAVGL
jgi:5'-deoxynucleotidase YfbR-like HD superfamily hydrolase